MGIDQSYTSTGCVIMNDDEIVLVDKFSTNKKDDIFDRSSQIAKHLVGIVEQFKPDRVRIEGLAFGIRGSATRDLAGLQFMIINSIRHCGAPNDPKLISPLSLKKFATGSGKSDKMEMLNKLPEDVKKFFVDVKGLKKSNGLFDIVDAYWLSVYKE